MRVYLLGIAGTGMGSFAGLLRKAGHEVSGSDENVYPPMSDKLAEWKIRVFTPYSADNLKRAEIDLAVVGNVLRADNVEAKAVRRLGIPHMSFPEALGYDFLAASRVFPRREEIADDKTLGAVERAAEQELREQAVEPVWRLVQILEKHEAAFELRLQRRAAHRRKACEIASPERSFSAAFARGPRGPGQRTRRLAEEQLTEPFHLGGILAELRAHRPVDGRHAPAAPQLVQDRRVAVADDELAWKLAQLGCEAEEPVTAAGEDQRLGVAAERVLELALAPRIVSREMARPGKDLLPEAGLEADAAQRLDAALEALAIEPARGGDDVDRVPWTERFHARSVP